MAKKKKWKDADYLREYDPSGSAGSNRAEKIQESFAVGNTEQGGKRFNSDVEQGELKKRRSEQYRSYLGDALASTGKTFYEQDLKNFQTAKDFLDRNLADSSKLLTKKEFNKKSYDNKQAHLNYIVENITANLNPDERTRLFKNASGIDYESMKKLASKSSDLKSVQSLIDDYKKKYGDDKDIATVSSYVKDYKSLIDSQTKPFDAKTKSGGLLSDDSIEYAKMKELRDTIGYTPSKIKDYNSAEEQNFATTGRMRANGELDKDQYYWNFTDDDVKKGFAKRAGSGVVVSKNELIDYFNKRGLSKDDAKELINYEEKLGSEVGKAENARSVKQKAEFEAEMDKKEGGNLSKLYKELTGQEAPDALKSGENVAKTWSGEVGSTIAAPMRIGLERTMGVDNEFSNTYRNAYNEEMKKDMSSAGKLVYDLTKTGAEIYGSSMTGGALNFAVDSADQGYYNAKQNGATDQEALTYGGILGAVTGGIYKFGIPGAKSLFSKAGAKGANSLIGRLANQVVEGEAKDSLASAFVKNVGKSALKGAGTFAGITAGTKAADVATQLAVLGDKSDYKRMYNSYKEQGLSNDEAWKNTAADLGKKFVSELAQSAATGAVFGAAGAAAGGLRQAREYNEMRDQAETLKGEYDKYTADKSSPYFEDVSDQAELDRQFKLKAKELHPDVAEGNEEAFNKLVSDKERIEGILSGKLSGEARKAIDNWENFVNQARDILGLDRVLTTKEREDFANQYDNLRNNLLETRDRIDSMKPQSKEQAAEIDNAINTIDNEIARVDNAVDSTADIVVPEESAELNVTNVKPESELTKPSVEVTKAPEVSNEYSVGRSANGNPIYIDKIKSGNVSFVDDKGNEVTEYEIDDSPQAELMELGVEKDFNTDTTKSMIKGYDRSNTDNVKQYADNYELFYSAGKDSTIKSFSELVKKAPEVKSAISVIGTDAAGKAFSEGRKVISDVKGTPLSKVPKGNFTNDTGKSNAATDYAELYAGFSGSDVVATEHPEKYVETKAEPGSIKAVYLGKEGKIIVNTKYPSFIKALNHDAKHLADDFAVDESKIVSDKCMNFARNKLGIKGADQAIKNLQSLYKENGQDISYSEAQNEFICNIVGTAMASGEGVDSIVEDIVKDDTISEEKKKSIIGKFIDWIKNLAKRLKEYGKASGAYEDTEFVLDEANSAERQDIIDSQLEALKTTRSVLEQFAKEFEGKESKPSVSDETNEAADGSKFSVEIDGVKYSITAEQKELADEYDKAVKENDEEKAAELVKEYAASKGYDTKVYHGTRDFGFTQIDLNKSDDKMTFWATSSTNTAQTYSGEYDVQEIGKTFKSLTPQQKIDMFTADNDRLKIEYVESNDIKSRIKWFERATSILDQKINDIKSVDKSQQEEIDTLKNEYKELSSRIKKNHFTSYTAKRVENILSKLNKINDRIARVDPDILGLNSDEHNWIPGYYFDNVNNVLDAIYNKDKSIYLREAQSMFDDDPYITEVKENEFEQAFNKYGKRKGNYQFYANINNFMTVDAEGENWNLISYKSDNPSIETLKSFIENYEHNIRTVKYDKDSKTFTAYNKYGEIVDDGVVTLDETLEAYKNEDEEDLYVKTRDLANDAIKNNYDGVLIKKVIDNGGRGNWNYKGADDVYIFFNPTEQVKSADPFTYDDNGDVVPLAKRFDESYDDIRYSLSEQEEETEIANIDDEIEKDTVEKALKDANKQLVNAFAELKGKKLTDYSLKKIAKNLRDNFNIDLTNSTIKEQLDKINNAIYKSSGNITTANVNEIANDVIKGILRYSKGEILPENQEILDDIKKTKIKISDKQKAGIQDYGHWFRNNKRNMTIARDGIALDSIWNEWVDKYPQYFSAETNEGDMPYVLEGVLNTLREGIPFDNRAEAIESYKTDLLYQFAKELEVKNKGFDKAFNRLSRLIENDYNKRIKEAIKEQSEYHDIELAEMRYNERKRNKEARIKKETTRLRQQNVKKLEKLKRAFTKPTIQNRVPEVLKDSLGTFLSAVNGVEMHRLDYYQKRIKNLENRLAYTTGEEYQEVQRQLKEMVDKKANLETAFIAFADKYKDSREVLEQQGEFSEPLYDSLNKLTGILSFSDNALLSMNENIKQLGGRSIMDFTLEEQQELAKCLNMIQTEINNYNKIVDGSIIGDNGEAQHISDVVVKGVDEIKSVGNRSSDWAFTAERNIPAIAKRIAGKVVNAKLKFSTKNLRPDVLLNRLFGWHKNNLGKQMFNMIEKGYKESLNVKKGALDILNTMFKTKEDLKYAKTIQKYDDKHLYDIGMVNDKGEPVKVPKGMVLSLKAYLMNPESRDHLIGDGLTIPNFSEYYSHRGGLDSMQQIVNGADSQIRVINRKIAEELDKEDPDFNQIKKWDMDVSNLVNANKAKLAKLEEKIDSLLTDWDKRYLDTHFKINDDYMKERLNQKTQLRFGVDQATVKKYTRLISDKDYFAKVNDGGYGYEKWQENVGFMKQRTGARNPIILEDILMADIDQINKSAQYIGYLIPQHNINRILKYTSEEKDANGNVKYGADGKPIRLNLTKTINRNYPSAMEYIDDLKMDLFGGKQKAQHGFIANTAMAIAAQQGLIGNINVELIQAGSYPFAAAELRYSSLAKALARGGKNKHPFSRADRELIDKYTPLLWDRVPENMQEVQAAMNDNLFIGRLYRKIAQNKAGAYLVGRIPKVDNATVGRLWYAAQYDVTQDIKDYNLDVKVGSDEYYQLVAEKFDRAVEKTQPMYAPAFRNELQRSNNPLVQMLEMFKTVLDQMYNTVYDSVGTYKTYKEDFKNKKYNTTKEDVKKSFKRMNRAITGFVLSGTFVFVVGELVKSLIYHKVPEEITNEDGEIEAGRIAKAYIDKLTGTWMGGLLLGSDFMGAVNSAADKLMGYDNKYSFDFSISVVDALKDMIDVVKESPNILDEEKRGNYLKNLTNMLVKLTGMPYKNTEKFVKGIAGVVEDFADDKEFNYSNVLEDKQIIRRWIKGNMSDKEASDYLVEENKQTITNAFKKLYQEGTITKEQGMKKMLDSKLFIPKGSYKNVPQQNYIEGKFEWWDIENKYKNKYLSTLDSDGNATDATEELIEEIKIMPHANAFYSNKKPEEAFVNKIKKWKKSKK